MRVRTGPDRGAPCRPVGGVPVRRPRPGGGAVGGLHVAPGGAGSRRGRGRAARRALMRVAAYTDSAGVGGAEISLEHLVRTAPAGVEVVVAGTSRATVERLAAARPGARALVVRRGVLAHAAAFAAVRPDVVHVNRCVPWATAAAACAALGTWGTRLVTVDQLPLRTTHAGLLWRTRALTLRADVAVAVGRVSARRVEDFYALGRGSVVSVPNGVPPVDAVRSAPPPGGELRVGSLGRLDPMKGYDVALRALARVDGVRLVVHGAGGEAARLTT